MPQFITLTTDFGSSSSYVAAMKGVILTINPQAVIVDVTHGIPPQDVRSAALMLDEVSRRFPPGTIHVAVVDPGVGTDRGLVYARIGQWQYLAPDNGLLSLLAQQTPPEKIVRLTRPEHWLPEVSATFHGRDILAPVAARLSLGMSPDQFGPEQSQLVMLDWPVPRIEERQITGAVWSVDSFGNLLTNISAEVLARVPRDTNIVIRCQGHETLGLVRTYGERPRGEIVALLSSHQRLEIAVVEGNAAQRLCAEVGSPVEIEW